MGHGYQAITPALANDSAFGGAGGSVAPVEDDRIRMVSEYIKMRLVPKPVDERDDDVVYDTEWRVHARYAFENTTEEEVELTIGFPELACGADNPCPGNSDYSMREFETTVDGEEVDHRVEQVDQVEGAEDWLDTLGRVYLFEATFEPGETLEIVHRFEHTPSGSVDGFQANYLTKTGRFWKGTIGQATFEVRVPHRHYYLAFPKEYELVEREHARRIEGDWRYVFRATDWTPEENFHVHFGNFVEAPGPRCPNIPDVDRAYDEIVESMSCDDKGVKCVKDDESDFPDRLTRAFHVPNPKFSTQLLSETEMRYVRAFKLVEASRDNGETSE